MDAGRRQLLRVAPRAALLSLLLVGLGLGSSSAQDTKAKGKAKGAALKFDLGLLPPDTVAAALAFPKRTLAKSDAKSLPLEVLSVWSQKQLGIDVATIEQALFALRHDGKSAEQPPLPLVVLRTDKPIDKAALLEKLMLNAEPQDVNGVAVHAPTGATQPLAAMFPSAQTLVLAPAPAMPTRQRAATQTGELFTRLRAAAGKDDIVAVFALDPVRELIDAQLAQRPAPPYPFSAVLDSRKQLASVELRASAFQPARLQLTLHATSESGAPALEGAANMLLAFGQMAMTGQLKQAPPPGSDPDINAAMQKYTERMMQSTFAELKPQREGSDVTMKIEGAGGPASTGIMAALLLPAVQAAREAARRQGGGQAVESLQPVQ